MPLKKGNLHPSSLTNDKIRRPGWPMRVLGRGFEVCVGALQAGLADVGVEPEDQFTQAPAQVTPEVTLELLLGSKNDSVTFQPARLLLP